MQGLEQGACEWRKRITSFLPRECQNARTDGPVDWLNSQQNKILAYETTPDRNVLRQYPIVLVSRGTSKWSRQAASSIRASLLSIPDRRACSNSTHPSIMSTITGQKRLICVAFQDFAIDNLNPGCLFLLMDCPQLLISLRLAVVTPLHPYHTPCGQRVRRSILV